MDSVRIFSSSALASSRRPVHVSMADREPSRRNAHVVRSCSSRYGMLAGQRMPRVPVHAERVGLAPAAVQREHQLRVHLLIERVLSGERFQSRQELPVLAEGEPGRFRRPGGRQR